MLKIKIVLVLSSLVVVSLAGVLPPRPLPPPLPPFVRPHPERGCLYILGRCVEPCPENTHAYTSACREAFSQRTCDEPQSQTVGQICDLSRCDCDVPLVLDKASNKCVLEIDCPKKITVLD